jgi:hypothetical protein
MAQWRTTEGNSMTEEYTKEINEAKRAYLKKHPYHTGPFDPNDIAAIINDRRAKLGHKIFISVIGPLYPARKKPKNIKR